MTDTLPVPLRPSSTLPVKLLSGEVVKITRCSPIFEEWKGTPPGFSFGGKSFIAMNGEALFAELAILRLLTTGGWEGVCVNGFSPRCYYTSMPRDALFTDRKASLPADKAIVLDGIASRAGGMGGCPDVYAWRGTELLFCEAKHATKDTLRPTQKRWIQGALSFGIPLDSLLIAEWESV